MLTIETVRISFNKDFICREMLVLKVNLDLPDFLAWT